MGKLKKILFSALSIISEYLTLFSTIIASTYIVVSSQYTSYSSDTLLLWIISLLGLISISIAAEKYFKLRQIEKGINEIKKKEGTSSLDQLFFYRRDLSPLEDRLKGSTDITITGGSLSRLSDEYYGLFERKLKEGCSIEVIMVKPETEAAKLLCKNIVYETSDFEAYYHKIKESIRRFAELKREYPQNINIFLSDQLPPFSLLAKNLNKEGSVIQVELYSYSVPTRERIEFNVYKSDVSTYSFFVNQINALRKSSSLIKVSDWSQI